MNTSAEKLTEEFVRESKWILGDNLVGIYLHGSAVMGCFNPLKSDIDLLVVVENDMPDETKRAYMDMVVALNAHAPAKGIEMSVVKREVCKPFVYPTPFVLHFSAMHLGWYRDNPDDYIKKMNGTDKDLAAHVTVIRTRGVCLYGEPVADVFGAVPAEDYMDSIWNDICDAEDDIAEDTMCLTVNLARVYAWQQEGKVLSKNEGGEWGLKNLPEKHHELLRKALSEYRGETPEYDISAAKEYACAMLRLIGNNMQPMNAALLGLFSGFPYRHFNDALADVLKENLPKRDLIVFISADPENYEQNDDDRDGMHEMLAEIGLAFAVKHVIDRRTGKDEAAKLIQEADCIWLMGGEPTWQIKLIRDLGIDTELHRSKAVILGVSAGSMNLGRNVAYIWDDPHFYEALGLTNITIKAHYQEGEWFIPRLKEMSMTHPIVAMEDMSAIYVKGDRIRKVGKMHLIDKGEIGAITDEKLKELNHRESN